MKRIRRHKYLNISIFFLLFSVIYAIPTNEDSSKTREQLDHKIHPMSNTNNNPPTQSEKEKGTVNAAPPDLTAQVDKTVSAQKAEDTTQSNTETSTKLDTDVHEHIMGMLGHHVGNAVKKHNHSKTEQTSPVTESAATSTEPSKGTTAINKDVYEHVIDRIVKSVHKTLETSESNCTHPAIEQFPHPIMSPWTRRHGGLIIHVIVAIYMFIGLAIVCDEYFVASLDRICEELKMSPDVAGATFMAAGSSAPELAIVIIGVFLATDDIGISGVIGSAVFNIMFVIACCGLCTSAIVYLNWWPLVRDCFFYAVSIVVMLIVIYDEQITWLESVVMLVTYLIYCVVLHYNTPLERYAQTLPVPFKHKAPTEQSGLVSYKTLEDDGKLPNYGMEWSQESQHQGYAEDSLQNFGMEWSPEKHQQEKGSFFAQASWVIVYPIHWLCKKTVPDCRSEKFKNWYPLTFFVSMIWISFYSYFMVWMITIIGYTMGIPDTVMGLTFVAAGVSVPDALSSIAVVREGYGDMAVSNAVGSNVFDILICLGLPWFISTAIVRPGSTVRVISKGLTYSTLSLLSTVVFLLVATHLNGWKLDRRYGIILLVWYLIFITLASMYELNVFGDLNPKECPSSW